MDLPKRYCDSDYLGLLYGSSWPGRTVELCFLSFDIFGYPLVTILFPCVASR